jgi:hypothetical protein
MFLFVCLFGYFYLYKKTHSRSPPLPRCLRPALLDPLRCSAVLGCVALALGDARCLLLWRRDANALTGVGLVVDTRARCLFLSQPTAFTPHTTSDWLWYGLHPV